jgi:hypothetical protein
MSDEDIKEGEEMQTVSMKNERGGYERVYTQKKSLGNKYFISFIVLMLITESYFVMQFVLRNQFYQNLSTFSSIFRTAYEDLVAFKEVENVYREYFTNSTTDFGRTTKLSSTVFDYWNSLYEMEKKYRDV